MKQNFDNLLFFGTVRDYRHFKVGDSVIIPRSESLLRKSLSRLYDMEKQAMEDHANRINSKLSTLESKYQVEIKFTAP